ACVEHHLEQEVAELLTQILEVAARDRLGDFIGLFDGVWRDRLEILLEVPGAAAAGSAQRRHEFEQTADIAGGIHLILTDPATAIHSSNSRKRYYGTSTCSRAFAIIFAALALTAGFPRSGGFSSRHRQARRCREAGRAGSRNRYRNGDWSGPRGADARGRSSAARPRPRNDSDAAYSAARRESRP